METVNSFKKKYPWIFWAILLTPILAFLALAPMLSENKADPLLLKLIYPYTLMLIALLQIEDSSTWAIIVYAGFLLYLIYSIVLTIAEKKGSLKKTKIIILITHVAAAVICMACL